MGGEGGAGRRAEGAAEGMWKGGREGGGSRARRAFFTRATKRLGAMTPVLRFCVLICGKRGGGAGGARDAACDARKVRVRPPRAGAGRGRHT